MEEPQNMASESSQRRVRTMCFRLHTTTENAKWSVVTGITWAVAWDYNAGGTGGRNLNSAPGNFGEDGYVNYLNDDNSLGIYIKSYILHTYS